MIQPQSLLEKKKKNLKLILLNHKFLLQFYKDFLKKYFFFIKK